MSCDKTSQVHAYHDGELPVEQRVALESHLRDCAECAELLRELQALSAMFASAALEPLPAGAMQRIEHAWDAIQDRAVLRISSWLTAAAAAVLVGAVFLVPKETYGVATEPDAVVQEFAVMTPVEHRDSARAESVAVAQFMVDELSTRPERQ